ncbi:MULTISPECIES: hypothetical protein [Rhodoplanes]|uniref:Uncharacterized protein n=1 Tax=Rhodoplanes serenus TaxID=200615 RepID=A0A327KFJ3_9BRAD|nr:hypothetical protein [Rhodoplanes serenus]RAI36403.1 hypothetical protein CH340_03085 [Rhodoplanes serenus]VCU07528.1 hypothetical protein RHODGE_RHODGE_00619 [Rhodoplanes serenus]
MKALVLYTLFVVIGAVLAALVGSYVERSVSQGMGLLVFLTLFFGNFVTSWIMTILAMDGTLRDTSKRDRASAAEPRRRPV